MTDEVPPPQQLQVGGPIPERALYIERPEDEEVYTLLKRGAYCNVLTSRQMGKSSLVNRARQRLLADGVRVIWIELSALGGDKLADKLKAAAAWYRSLMLAVANRMRAAPAFNAWWKERPAEETMGARFQAFVEELLLRDAAPVVVVFDEVDATRSLDFTDDLFLTIRSLHNARVERPELERIAFCLVGVLSADDLIKTTTRTPYNIGQTLRLSDFSRTACEPLVAYLDGKGLPGAKVVDDVLAWTSGQPFLTTALCDKAARRGPDVEGIVRAELANPTMFKVHFDRIQALVKERIVGSSQARAKYLKMLDGKPARGVPERDEESLLLAGLVHRDAEGGLRLRNRIYGMRFDRRWVKAILPEPPVPRWAWAAAAAVVVAGVSVGGILWSKARDQERKAILAAQQADWQRRTSLARGMITEATDDDRAKEAWRDALKLGVAGEPVVLEARQTYWAARQESLNALAGTLDAAGCWEEAIVVRAFMVERAGGNEAPPAPDVGATLWMPLSRFPASATEVGRCKDRRGSPFTRVALAAGELIASNLLSLVIFRPDAKPVNLTARGQRATLFGPNEAYSIGTQDSTLVVQRDSERAAFAPCVPLPFSEPTSVTRLDVQTHGEGATIACVCANGRFFALSVPDVNAWFEDLKVGKMPSNVRTGFGVGAATWVGNAALTARPGRDGRVEVDGGPKLAIPHVSALAGWSGVGAAFGTEGFKDGGTTTPPTLGVLRVSDNSIDVRGKWPVASCVTPACLFRAVALGGHVEQWLAAGVLVGVNDIGKQQGTWLVLAGLDSNPRVIDLGGEPILDVTVGTWRGQTMAAVPLPGRIRAYSWQAQEDGSWDATQRRFGLTVHSVVREQDGGVRREIQIDELDDVGPQRVARFEDVFPAP